MNLTLALVPIIGLLALALVSIIVTSLRSARMAALKADHEAFVQKIVKDDALLQQSLVDDLLEGKPVGETLEAFERRRAALLPGAPSDEPAAWDADMLHKVGCQRLTEQTAEVNRKVTTTAIVIAVAIVGTCLVSVAALYQFLPATPTTPAMPPAPPLSFEPLPADSYSPPVPPEDQQDSMTPPSGDTTSA